MMGSRTTLLIAVGICTGLLVGAGGYTFLYAKGYSYLTDDPSSCANCHVMQEQYDGWVKSSHRAVAVCNDCHTPAGFFAKYAVKANNGFWHSFYFTTETFHEPIQITSGNRAVTEGACRKCHSDTVDAMHIAPAHGPEMSCIRCHGSVGHLD